MIDRSTRARGPGARPAVEPPAAPSGRRVVVTAAALTAVWCGSALFRIARLPPGRLDRQWDAVMTSLSSPVTRRAAEALAVVGNGTPATSLVVAVGACIGATRGWFWAASLGTTAIISVLQVAGLEALAQRTRPDPAYGVRNAFPSGHTTFAALLGSAVILFDRKPAVRGVAVAFIGAMAWSRTALRAHWLSDVVGAIVLGASEAVLSVAAAHALRGITSRGPARSTAPRT